MNTIIDFKQTQVHIIKVFTNFSSYSKNFNINL